MSDEARQLSPGTYYVSDMAQCGGCKGSSIVAYYRCQFCVEKITETADALAKAVKNGLSDSPDAKWMEEYEAMQDALADYEKVRGSKAADKDIHTLHGPMTDCKCNACAQW